MNQHIPAFRTYLAEAAGTFALVFAGTGAIIINDITAGVITHVGVALTFGLVVMAVIYSIGEVSGAHINPAVTFGFWAAGRFPGLMAGTAIGGTVGLEALFAGPITGASMNPARSLAPALVALDLSHQWIYVVAPIIGAFIAVLAYRAIYGDTQSCLFRPATSHAHPN